MESIAYRASLVDEFCALATKRFDSIGALLFELRQDPQDHEVLSELFSMFHNLAGLAGSCGFPLCGRRSRSGESLCHQILSGQRSPSDSEFRALLDILMAMKQCLSIERQTAEGSESDWLLGHQLASVLVLEWTDPAREIWLSELADAGFVGSGVGSATELLAALATQTYDAVIADAELLARDGFLLLNRIRSENPQPPVIILCGTLRSLADKVTAIRLGADAYYDAVAPRPPIFQRLQELIELRHQQPGRILIVDDDPMQTAWLRAVLAPAGYLVQSCQHPAHFEKELATAHPDLIILDLMLPGGIQGSDLARYVQQHDSYRKTPLIILSGLSYHELRAGAIPTGSLFLHKPVLPDQLRQAVRSCLKRTGCVPIGAAASYGRKGAAV
jgi:DNA-binding response OmpR family regulator